jgi:TatD DNase family protein
MEAAVAAAAGTAADVASGHRGTGVIDTHCHLSSSQFAKDREAALARAFAAGVSAIVEVGYSLEKSRSALALARRHDAVFATVGIHPHEAARCRPEDLDEIARLARSGTACAIGETGLDFYRGFSPAGAQRDLFRWHIALALETGLPLVIHTRAASDEMIATLRETGAGRAGGSLHAYHGDPAFARAGIDLGFHLGIGGSLTKDPSRMREAVRGLPLDRLLLETDAPYLSPRGAADRRNEPANIPLVARALAGALGMHEDEVSAATDAAARALFRPLGAA